MFHVWDVNCLQREYVPGELRVRPRVTAVQSSTAVQAKTVEEDKRREALKQYQRKYPAPKERPPAVLVSQIMSSPVRTLTPELPISEARNFIETHRFRHVPIVDGNGKLVGILSDRDILSEDDTRLVKDVMTTNVLTAVPETEIRNIARVFFQERIGAMPVVSADGGLVGILTRSDILRTVVNTVPFEIWV